MKILIKLITASVLAILALLLLGGPASAQCPNGSSPDGDSGVDQYSPSIPGSCGNEGPGGNQGNTFALPDDTTKALNSLGSDGGATAAAATATAPDTAVPGDSTDSAANKGGNGAATAGSGGDSGDSGLGGAALNTGSAFEPAGSSLSALLGALSGGSGGAGFVLPLALLGSALLIPLALLLRRRGSL